MKVLATITLRGSQGGSGRKRSDRQRPAADRCPWQAIPFGTRQRYSDSLLQGRNRFIAPFRGQALNKMAQCAPAFAKPASAGEGWSDKIMLKES